MHLYSGSCSFLLFPNEETVVPRCGYDRFSTRERPYPGVGTGVSLWETDSIIKTFKN